MFAPNSSSPAAPPVEPIRRAGTVHLLLVEVPSLTPRGQVWLEHAKSGAFDAIELQRLLRFEKLSLG